jgi:hypothetical protein
VSGPDSYTAFGFANPTRRVLAAVLSTRAEVRRADSRASGSAAGGQGARSGPGPHPAPGTARDQAGPAVHVGYSSDVIEVVEVYVYRPLLRPFLLLVRLAKRLQSGRLDAYLAYMLIALIALLAVVTAVH